MEKHKPHYPLTEILAQMQTVEDMNLTSSARIDIRAIGMSQAEALNVLHRLTKAHF